MSLWNLIYSQESNNNDVAEESNCNDRSDIKDNQVYEDLGEDENSTIIPLDTDQSFSTSSGIDSDIQGYNRIHGKKSNIHIYGDKPVLGISAKNLVVYNNSPEVKLTTYFP
jgi:hypothetical protein